MKSLDPISSRPPAKFESADQIQTDSGVSSLRQTVIGRESQSDGIGVREKFAGRVVGSYVLERKLGQGGMGEVWLASHTTLERPVAIKFLARHLTDKPEFVKRFYREARAMALLKHPHAIDVYDVGDDFGEHFVTMEFVDGLSMDRWLKRVGKLDAGDAIHVVLRCADALAAAHRQNLIHRDVKPDNILLSSTGWVKVSDFGLAKALDDVDLSMTPSGTGLGTPHYMAPEQGRNAKHVDGRCDVYALGVTLYQLLTGRPPFVGTSAVEILLAKEKGAYEPAKKLNRRVPQRLDDVISRMIASKVDQRYRSFDEVIRDLRGLGLESETLTFLSKSIPEAKDRPSSPGTDAARIRVDRPSSTAAPRSSAEDAQLTSSQTTPAAHWFVQFMDPLTGKASLVKWPSAKVLRGLKQGLIPADAKAKLRAGEAWLPIGHYAEFEAAVRSTLTKRRVERDGNDLKSIYAKLDKQENRRQFKRRMLGHVGSFLGFIRYCVMVTLLIGVIWLALSFLPVAADYIATRFKLK